MRVLGYAQTRPHLRLLTVADETVEASPVALDRATAALDRAWLRDGWIAFNPNEEIWGVPLPLAGSAFKVGRWWRCAPALNPRTVWLESRVEPDPDASPDPDAPTIVAEYDGMQREIVRELSLAPGLGLAGVAPEGLVMTTEAEGLVLWDVDSGVQREIDGRGRHWVVATERSSVASVVDETLMLFDLATGNSAVVDKPLEGDWGLDGRFSPDGRRLAAVLTSADVSRLVLVDAHTAAVVTADGTFENFAYPPVWTQDGRWLVFDAPFDKSLFACDVDADLPALLPFLRRRGRVAPLVDVTGYAG